MCHKHLALKISPLIAKYLQENKNVNLEGFGRFFISDATLPTEGNEKNATAAQPAQYVFEPNVITDQPFIEFVIKETGKIRPLAIADLETYISLAKQLLNISKPFVIDGVGTLTKQSAGHYEFAAGNYEPPKINTENERDKRLRQAKEVNRESQLKYSKDYANLDRVNRKPIMKKVLGAATLFLLLGLSAWAVYTFVIKKDKETTTAKVENTTTDNTIKKDTIIQPSTSTITTKDSLGRIPYTVVIRTADSINAYKRFSFLKTTDCKDYVSIVKGTDGQYRVALQVKAIAQDTLRIKDSIDKIYPTTGQKAYIMQ